MQERELSPSVTIRYYDTVICRSNQETDLTTYYKPKQKKKLNKINFTLFHKKSFFLKKTW